MNDDERAFVVACRLAVRDDELPRKIYADWLDEQGRQLEADRARSGRPRLGCACAGLGYCFTGGRNLVCPRCRGQGTVDRWEAGPVESGILAQLVTEPCAYCGGRGRSAVFSVCEECNGRWTPPLVPLSPGDSLYVDSHGRCVPYRLTQGQKPVATYVRRGNSVGGAILADSDMLPGRQLILEDGRPRRFREDD